MHYLIINNQLINMIIIHQKNQLRQLRGHGFPDAEETQPPVSSGSKELTAAALKRHSAGKMWRK